MRAFSFWPGGAAVTATGAALPLLLRDNTVTLCWRPQFAPEKARCFHGFHRIANRDQALINVFPNEENGMGVKPLPVSRETTERGGGLPTLTTLR
jgi:hypothetical protein